MPSGFIYVLVNASMPGLVKIGKTTRSPAERAAELSSATGVASPFMVVFEQLFVDCDSAEDFVHAELEQQGVRPGQNREFFQATPNEAIRVILRAPGLVEGGAPLSENESDEIGDDADLLSPDSIHTLNPEWPRSYPWDDLIAQAGDFYYGHSEEIEDHSEALRLYRQAARLGSLFAYEQIGRIYHYGRHGVRKDLTKAMQFLREGGKRGNYYCYAEMAFLLDWNGRHEDAQKALRNFFISCKNHLNPEVENYEGKYAVVCKKYILTCVRRKWRVEFVEVMGSVADEILMFFDSSISDSDDDKDYQLILIQARNWAATNLQVPRPTLRAARDGCPLISAKSEAEARLRKPRTRWWLW